MEHDITIVQVVKIDTAGSATTFLSGYPEILHRCNKGVDTKSEKVPLVIAELPLTRVGG